MQTTKKTDPRVRFKNLPFLGDVVFEDERPLPKNFDPQKLEFILIKNSEEEYEDLVKKLESLKERYIFLSLSDVLSGRLGVVVHCGISVDDYFLCNETIGQMILNKVKSVADRTNVIFAGQLFKFTVSEHWGPVAISIQRGPREMDLSAYHYYSNIYGPIRYDNSFILAYPVE
jgi:hypothetical protein